MKKGIQPSGMLTRKKILSASIKIFLQKGYAGATAKEIAELAGTSSGSPFLPFGNKEGVLFELVQIMFSNQFGLTERVIGEKADPLLLYGVETGIQLNITELSEPLRELYVVGYTLQSTSEYIYEQTTKRLETIFAPYLPKAQTKDFYELEIASSGVMRSFMAKPCDIYFTMEQKLRRFLSCCYKLYDVPEKVYGPIVEQVVRMDLKSAAETLIQRMEQFAEESFRAVMAEAETNGGTT